jgi:hypothetical protein
MSQGFFNFKVKLFHIVIFLMLHNVLQLGEVADLEALTFNLALMFI